MATGQTTTTAGYYDVSMTTPVTLTATCGGDCGCSSPMSATSLITDGSSATNNYKAEQDCEWKISGPDKCLRFTRFRTEAVYDKVVVSICTTSLCNAYSGSYKYDGDGPVLDQNIPYKGDFMHITFISDNVAQYLGLSASYGTTATTI
jgi:hypothetical protein